MNSSTINNPDFTTTILRNPLKQTVQAGEVAKKYGAGKNTASASGINAKKIENEEVPLLKSPIEMGRDIASARMKLNLKQDELDLKCGFPKNTTKTYENGTAIINPTQLSKYNAVLGLKLKKPKVVVKNDDN